MTMTPDFSKIFNHPIYIVGGVVRDQLLGKESKDIDIASNLRPLEFKKKCQELRLKTFDTGIEHGTVTVLIKGEAYEHTTFRFDVSCDGRNATIQFSDTVEEDLARRDFTINAMALLDGKLVDPYGGQEDLEKKFLRTVGKAQERFSEDLLRIVRAARFAARFELSLEPELVSAARELSPQIMQHVSIERIVDELKKARPWAQAMLEECENLGFRSEILAFSKELEPKEKQAWLNWVNKASKLDEESLFAALFAPLDEKAICDYSKKMKLSKKVLNRCLACCRHAKNLRQDLAAPELLAIMQDCKKDYPAVRAYSQAWAELEQESNLLKAELEQACIETLDQPLINGAELQNLGFKAGPEFKKIIQLALEQQALGNKKEEIVTLIQASFSS